MNAETNKSFPEYPATELVLPPSSVGKMTLRRYSALSYSHNSASDIRCALNGE